MTFMVDNEGIVNLNKPETIDGLREELDSLYSNLHKARLEIRAKAKRLDEICGANPDSLAKARKEATQSRAECERDSDVCWDNAEANIAEYHIFDILEMYGEYNPKRTAKIEADIAATKMLRNEL